MVACCGPGCTSAAAENAPPTTVPAAATAETAYFTVDDFFMAAPSIWPQQPGQVPWIEHALMGRSAPRPGAQSEWVLLLVLRRGRRVRAGHALDLRRLRWREP